MNRQSTKVISVLALMTLAGVVICRVFESSFAELTIDWVAFLAGIFLVVEGLYKFFASKDPTAADQALRMIRVLIGMCVFTIHLLQFMRY